MCHKYFLDKKNGGAVGCGSLVAFHPRPQIASDLGRNVTRSPNPHQNRKRFPSGNEIFGLMAADSNRNRPQPAAI